jgi:hypothetical protein
MKREANRYQSASEAHETPNRYCLVVKMHGTVTLVD